MDIYTCKHIHVYLLLLMVCMKETGYYMKRLYIFASTSTFRFHSAIKNHCQIICYANRSTILGYFMNFWTEKNT